ncbi:MAG: UDP-glucose/GDP-mannose dehydrogenase family protein [Gammaproteobacteria bacterium]|nr:UDP-glucose/GDP-mannose dehydrogenase family protein [Gammaproteobacteria bacterium]
MKVTIFGTGYVGLVTGTCFAEMGNAVLCVDVDAERIKALAAGRIPIHEPGLAPLVAANAAAGRLRFTQDADQGVDHGEILFIAVGTPARKDGQADLRFVFQVAERIGRRMVDAKIVVDKSTVPVGTADQVRAIIGAALRQRGADFDFDVVANPEFLKEGAAVNDFMRPDRIVIGANQDASRARLERLYEPFSRNRDKFVHMDARSAELCKYAANAMLATRISLMNELANVAEAVGADIEAVRLGVGRDPRIGTHFIYAGAGYGGACLPKDVKALIHAAAEAGVEAQVMKSVERVNERQKGLLVRKMRSHYGAGLNGRTIALWGLAFKPNTNDMREAPSRRVIDELLAAGARVRAYDPVAGDGAKRLYGRRIAVCDSRGDAVAGADGLAILTEWNEFRSPDFGQLRSQLLEPTIFDGRNLYDPRRLGQLGFNYYSIGRPPEPRAASEKLTTAGLRL